MGPGSVLSNVIRGASSWCNQKQQWLALDRWEPMEFGVRACMKGEDGTDQGQLELTLHVEAISKAPWSFSAVSCHVACSLRSAELN